jgi:hypothetical protein
MFFVLQGLILLKLEVDVTPFSCVEAAHAIFVIYFNKGSKSLAAKR